MIQTPLTDKHPRVWAVRGIIGQCALTIALLMAALSVCAQEAFGTTTLQDGPYLWAMSDGDWVARWVEGDTAAPRIREQTLAIGQSVEVPAVGLAPAFRVPLRGRDPIAPDKVALPKDVPLFVVADTHGQFLIFVQLLRKHGVIDEALRWSYGRGHLAILGDVFDRGPNHTEILWLIYKLEAEAAQAGGGVHFVLGNHEQLVMLGDELDQHRKYRHVFQALKLPGHAWLWDETTFLGRWLRTKASVLKLGDYLLVHGGISRKLVERAPTIAQMNQVVRDVLAQTAPAATGEERPPLLGRDPKASDADREMAQFVLARTGPLWYRGYFNDEATAEDLARACKLYGVKSILVGHTIVDRITPMYDGRAIAVQVYPGYAAARDGSPIAEAVRIEQGRMYRAKVDGFSEPLQPALQRILREAIAAEGVAGAQRTYQRLKRRGLAGYEVDEERINAQGHEYLEKGKTAEALLLFKVNAEHFPSSWNVYDSLGEAYEKNGQREQAIASYRKSLTLGPKNKHAAARLAELAKSADAAHSRP